MINNALIYGGKKILYHALNVDKTWTITVAEM